MSLAAQRTRRLPILTSFAGYQRRWVKRDVIAGLTLWAVLVPESLAYATIAGVSPVVGLYAAPPALVLYALFGSSKHLAVGPGAASAALSAAAVAELTTGGPENFAAFTAMLAIMTGLFALVAGLLRLGFLASFISEPVMKGFVIGLALTIIVGQLPKIFGFEKGEGDFFEEAWHFLTHLDETQWRTLVVGVLSFAIVMVLRRFAPVVPASLVAVVFGIGVVHLFDLGQHGVAIVGHIESGLPSIGLPHELSLSDYFAASASAVGIMLVAFAEGLGAAKTYAAQNHYEIDPNRELVGVGALIRLFRLSTSRLGKIYGVAARPDFIAAMAAMFGVLIFDTLPGLFMGIAVSLLLLLYRASHPHIAELGKVEGSPDRYADLHRAQETAKVPGVAIVRVEGGLFFANAEGVAASIRAHANDAGVRAVVLDGESISFVDSTAISVLVNTARQLDADGVRLVLAHDIGQVRDLLQASEAQRLVHVFYPTVQAAVDAVT